MKHDPIETPKAGADLLKPKDLYVSAVRTYEAKCKSTGVSTFFSGILGGALIGLAGLFYLVVMTENNLSGGIAKLIGGGSFSLGLVMISVTGSDLFTGNVMAILPKFYRMVSALEVLRNWVTVFLSNFAGALAISLAAVVADMLVGPAQSSLATLVDAKLSQSPASLLVEGILCNMLVCLGIWMGLATQSPTGRILLIAGPITAFVAMGLEHSIANIFFFTAAYLAQVPMDMALAGAALAIVTIGNVLGAVLLSLFLGFSFRHATLPSLTAGARDAR